MPPLGETGPPVEEAGPLVGGAGLPVGEAGPSEERAGPPLGGPGPLEGGAARPVGGAGLPLKGAEDRARLWVDILVQDCIPACTGTVVADSVEAGLMSEVTE